MITKRILIALLPILTILYCCKGKTSQTEVNNTTEYSYQIAPDFVTGEVIDTTGCFMYHPDDYPDNYTVIRKDEKAGVIDEKNRVIIPCIYASVESMFHNQKFIVLRNEDRRCGIVEYKTGRIVTPFDFHSFDRISHTDRYILAYGDGQKYCIIDLHAEKEILPSRYWTILGDGGHFFCYDGRGFQLIDSTSTVVLPKLYQKALSWEDNKESLGFIVQHNEKYGVVMNKGKGFKEVIPCEYDDISDFYTGPYIPIDPIQVLNKNGKYGILSTTGEILLPCEYDEFSDEFIEGLITTSKNGKWGLVEVYKDRLTEVVPCIYDSLVWSSSEDTKNINAVGTLSDGRKDVIDYEKYVRK